MGLDLERAWVDYSGNNGDEQILKVLDHILGYALLVQVLFGAKMEILTPRSSKQVVSAAVSFMQHLKDAELEQVGVISPHEFPLESILQQVFDGRSALGFFESLDDLSQDLEEVHSGLILQIGALAFDIVHVVGNLVFVAPECRAEPVQSVL